MLKNTIKARRWIERDIDPLIFYAGTREIMVHNEKQEWLVRDEFLQKGGNEDQFEASFPMPPQGWLIQMMMTIIGQGSTYLFCGSYGLVCP